MKNDKTIRKRERGFFLTYVKDGGRVREGADAGQESREDADRDCFDISTGSAEFERV